ncbi:MAG TPA: hypothetical protein VJN65_04225 [Bacteroidota bacterium]|nr:hypothetical protein [Bacteroidota bacterium]
MDAQRIVRIAGLLLLTVAASVSFSQTGPFTVQVRFGVIDTTCYPSCDHPTEWSLELFADIYDANGILVPPSSSYLYEWGSDFCRGFGFGYGWAVGMGLSAIHPDGNKVKNEPGCCQLCPYQTYRVGVRVTINGTTVASPIIRIPDGSQTPVATSQPAYPNPLKLSSDRPLTLPLHPTTQEVAAVFILTASFDLVLARDYRVVESFGVYSVSVPASDLRTRLQSGIHFVVARLNGEEYRWKVAFIQ